MNTKDFIEAIEKTYADAVEIVKRKNKDYATEIDPFRNFRYAQYCNVSVEKAILVRVSDKFARIANLLDKNEIAVSDEKVVDTLQDMINYLTILKVYLESETVNQD